MKQPHDLLREIAQNDDHTIDGKLTRDGMIIMDAAGILEGLFDVMDGQEWSADTLDAIAGAMEWGGYKLRDYEESET